MMDALTLFAEIRQTFQKRYAAVLESVLQRQLPTTLCAIYYPNYPDDFLQEVGQIAVSVFNDVVMAEAFRRKLPLIDLRLVCSESRDYANPIEPSAIGGAKIAHVIYHVVSKHDFTQPQSCVYWD